MTAMLQSPSTTDTKQQRDWLERHIPHGVRAALARLEPLLSEYLGTPTPGDPDLKRLTKDANIRRRCEMNSVNEGRFAAIRWLIEFVSMAPKRNDDVGIEYLGGTLLAANSPEGQKLEDVRQGCNKASSHATIAYGHADISDAALCAAMRLVVAHLQTTIYDSRKLKLIDLALTPDEIQP